MCRHLESSDPENYLSFKNPVTEGKGNTSAGKWDLMFIRALRAAVIRVGFWKRLVALPAKGLGVQPV